MKIVVFGSSLAGQHLATFFSKENHQIIALDTNPNELLDLSQKAEIETVCGSPFDTSLLKEINSSDDAIFLALTKETGTNLSACLLAKTLNYKKTIALITEKDFFETKDINLSHLFQIDYIISPEIKVSHELIKHILYPGALLVERFANGKVQMQTYVMEENWQGANKPLSSLDLKDSYLAVLIKRTVGKNSSSPQIIYPRGDTIIQSGDEVTFVGTSDDMFRLPELIGKPKPSTKNVCVCGSSFVTTSFAKLLDKHHISLKIIESNLKACEKLSRELPFATIIHHEETDKEFLIEENIASADIVVSSSPSTEKNLLISSIAQDLGCKNILSLVSDEKFSPLFAKFNVPFVFSEQISFYNQLCSHILGNPYSAITDLYPDTIKIVETQISAKSSLCGKKVHEIEHLLPKPSILALIKRDQNVELARGASSLNEGDFLIAFLDPNQIEAFYKLF